MSDWVKVTNNAPHKVEYEVFVSYAPEAAVWGGALEANKSNTHRLKVGRATWFRVRFKKPDQFWVYTYAQGQGFNQEVSLEMYFRRPDCYGAAVH